MYLRRIEHNGCLQHPLYILDDSVSNIHKNTEYISRMVEFDFFLDNEITIYKILITIPNYDSHFYIFQTYKKITYNELKKDSGDITLSNQITKSDLVLLKYRKQILYSFKELMNPDLHDNTRHYIRFLKNTYTKLLDSIKLLIENQIVHNHISYDNICLDEKDNPLVVHFRNGLYMDDSLNNNTTSMTNYISKHFTIYDPGYTYWPLEVHFLAYLTTNKMQSVSRIHIVNIIQDIISKNNIFIKLDCNDVENYKKEGLQFLSKYINKPIHFIIEDIMMYKCTWDHYALNIVFFTILWEAIEKHDIADVFINYFILLLINIRADPTKRMSLKECSEKIQRIYYDLDISS